MEEDELDQHDSIIKLRDEHKILFNEKKMVYENLATESTKYFMRFYNRLKGDRRTEFKRLMNEILSVKFRDYDFFNPIGEEAEFENYTTYYPIKNEIYKTKITEFFFKEIEEPIQKMMMEEISSVIEVIDKLGNSNVKDLFFVKVPIN